MTGTGRAPDRSGVWRALGGRDDARCVEILDAWLGDGTACNHDGKMKASSSIGRKWLAKLSILDIGCFGSAGASP